MQTLLWSQIMIARIFAHMLHVYIESRNTDIQLVPNK